jgi:hypothetical protein
MAGQKPSNGIRGALDINFEKPKQREVDVL